MNNKTVYIICLEGLGNRLFSLIGGLYWAKKTRSAIKIVWHKNSECGCNYSDLFCAFNDCVITLSEFRRDLLKIKCATVAGFNHQVDALKNDIFLKSINTRNIFNDLKNPNNLQEFDQILIYSYVSLPIYINVKLATKLLSLVKIKNNIVKRASSFIEKNNVNTDIEGFILRKTDADNFIDIYKIKNYVLKQNKNFFIMSDEKHIEDTFKVLSNVLCFIKKHYVVYNKKRGILIRSKQSVIEAFISLLIASRTNIKDVTKNKSTFTKIALLYKNIKF